MVAFGGLSDVVTITSLALKTYRYLKASGVAIEHYESAKRVLANLNAIVGYLETLLQDEDDNVNNNALRAQVSGARAKWHEFKDYLDGYEEGLDSSVHILKPRRLYRTARWTIKEIEGEVEKLQSATIHRTMLSTPIMLASMIERVHMMEFELRGIAAANADAEETPVSATAIISSAVVPDHPITTLTFTPCWQTRSGCLCRCHTIDSAPGRFFFHRRYGLGAIFITCSLPSCNSRKYGFSFRVALSRLMIPIAIDFTIELQTYFDGFRIGRSLQCQRIVPYTAEVFQHLQRLQAGHFLCGRQSLEGLTEHTIRENFQVAVANEVATIKTMFRNRLCSATDVDPSGETFLQKLLRVPWNPGTREAQWDLMAFVINEFPTEEIQTNPKILYRCFTWIGEGPHLDLLDTLLELGLDPGAMNVELFHMWPALSSPNWISESLTPDPFGLIWTRACLSKHPEFAGCSLLCEAMLLSTKSDFIEALQGANVHELGQSNALGQSILHFAVLLPDRLEWLLEAGCDPNTVDCGGSTPLMYAAAYGKSASVCCLLKFSAQEWIFDHRNHRMYLDYAVRRNHLHVILGAVHYVRNDGRFENALDLLDRCLLYYLVNGVDRWRSKMLEVLLVEGADPDCIVRPDEHGTAMHLVLYEREGLAIMNAPAPSVFTNFDVEDEYGLSPLMSVVRSQNTASPTLVRKMLESGGAVTVDAQDMNGWTALMYLVESGCKLKSVYMSANDRDHEMKTRSSILACINILICEDAEIMSNDHCICACSSNGCTVVIASLYSIVHGSNRWCSDGRLSSFVLDLLACICTFKMQSLETILRDIDRFIAFEEKGLRHTCCCGRSCKDSRGLLYHNDQASLSQDMVAHDLFKIDYTPETGPYPDMIDCLAARLVKLYAHAQSISYKRYEDAEERRARDSSRNQDHGAVNGLVIDTTKDCMYTSSVMPYFGPKPARLDLNAHETWIQGCKDGGLELHLKGRRDKWLEVSQRIMQVMRRGMASLDTLQGA